MWKTVANIGIGSLVSAILLSLPGGPMIGGLIVGYIENGGRIQAAKVGIATSVVAIVIVTTIIAVMGGNLNLWMNLTATDTLSIGLRNVIIILYLYIFIFCTLGSLMGNHIARVHV